MIYKIGIDLDEIVKKVSEYESICTFHLDDELKNVETRVIRELISDISGKIKQEKTEKLEKTLGCLVSYFCYREKNNVVLEDLPENVDFMLSYFGYLGKSERKGPIELYGNFGNNFCNHMISDKVILDGDVKDGLASDALGGEADIRGKAGYEIGENMGGITTIHLHDDFGGFGKIQSGRIISYKKNKPEIKISKKEGKDIFVVEFTATEI